jgi:predicted pyridoxine 5'-phosphate oxidase superfamily flavin-nucleotide-binding protein
MLRVELPNAANTLTIRIEGRFVGTFAEEVRMLMARCKIPWKLVVDVSEVTFVDSIGEQVLDWLGRIGGKFVAENSYPRDVCERLDLALVPVCNGSSFPGNSQGQAKVSV